MIKMTKKHFAFVDAFTGNIVEAMRTAGFSGVDSYLEQEGTAFLKDPTIREAMRQRDLYTASSMKHVADRIELQSLWTSIARNKDPHHIQELNEKGVTKPPENIPLSARLKATELLGKSEGMFIEKVDVTHNLTITDLVRESYTIPMDNIDAIEAEYEHQREQKKKLVDVKNEHIEPLRDPVPVSELDDLF